MSDIIIQQQKVYVSVIFFRQQINVFFFACLGIIRILLRKGEKKGHSDCCSEYILIACLESFLIFHHAFVLCHRSPS